MYLYYKDNFVCLSIAIWSRPFDPRTETKKEVWVYGRTGGRVVGPGIARAKPELRLLARPRTPKASDGPSAGPRSGPLREYFPK